MNNLRRMLTFIGMTNAQCTDVLAWVTIRYPEVFDEAYGAVAAIEHIPANHLPN